MFWFDISTSEKLYLVKKGPIFVGSYATQNKVIPKTLCWHQLFRHKWAFPRLSTSVLHKCGHTNDRFGTQQLLNLHTQSVHNAFEQEIMCTCGYRTKIKSFFQIQLILLFWMQVTMFLVQALYFINCYSLTSLISLVI